MAKILSIISLVLMAFVANAVAMNGNSKEGCGVQDCTACHKLSNEEAQKIVSFTGATVKSVKNSPSRGLYEILLEGNGRKGIMLVDYAKKHFFQGVAVDLETKKPAIAHASELPPPPAAPQEPVVNIKTLPKQHAIVMGNKKAAKSIYVFTDPDCPYCRQLHPHLQELAAKYDIAVNIMLMPIRQLHPQAYDKSRVVMASKSIKHLDVAFEGKNLPAPASASAGKAGVDAILKFANEARINGTPAIFGPDGKMLNVPRTAEAIAAAVGAPKR